VQKFLLQILCICLLVMGTACSAYFDVSFGEPGPSDFLGSWSLQSITSPNGNQRCSADEGPLSGQIVYTRDGRMSAQLGCPEMSMQNLGALSAQQIVARQVRRHTSYYGTYTIDEEAGSVTHHIIASSNANLSGDTLRYYSFEGRDRLILSPGNEVRIVWTRN
jgi:hypothetical protein